MWINHSKELLLAVIILEVSKELVTDQYDCDSVLLMHAFVTLLVQLFLLEESSKKLAMYDFSACIG